MDLKQAYISLGWKIDDSNLKKAKSVTDDLIDTIKRNGVSASKDFADSFRNISDKADATKSSIKSLIDTQKSINDVNLDHPLHDMDNFKSSIDKSIGAVDSLKDKLKSLSVNNSTVRTPSTSGSFKEETKTSERPSLGNTVIGGAVGGLVGGAVASIGSYVTAMSKMAFAADQGAQKVQLAWQTMGVKSASSVKSLTSQIGELTKQANISGADTTAAQKSFYNATNGNIAQTKALTNEFFAFGRATGMTDQQVVQATGSMGRMFNTAKVRATVFTRITKQMPAMRNAIIAASGESSAKFMADMNAGKISGTQLRDLMVKAASQSGKAWDDYGKTAGGAIAKLEGTQTQIWKDTFKQMAGTSNEGLIQLSNLVQKNEKPIAAMMGGIGKGLANIASGAINFLVANQRPLGSIANSLISIGKTIGSTVWSIFSSVIKGIGDAFGLVSGNSKKSESPMQIFADILKDIADQKTAIRIVATTLTGMFVAKKALAFAKSLKEVAGAIGLVNSAEAASSSNSKSGILGTLLDYGTSIGGRRKVKPQLVNRFDDSFSLASDKESLASNLQGASLGTLAEKESNGAFRAAKDVEVGGSFLPEASKLGRFGKLAGAGSLLFGSTKLGSLVDKGGLKAAQGLTKFGSSGLLKSVTGVASKVPFLDVAAAGLNMVGTNRHNVGSKAGSSIGMLAGSIGGGVFGGPLGAIAGGMAGQALGGTIGKTIQHAIPKNAFKSIETSWDSLTKKIGNSSFGKAITGTFDSIKKTVGSTFNSIGKAFKPVTQGIGQFVNAAKKSEIVKWYLSNAGDGFKILGKIASVSFKGILSVVKGITIGIGTFLKDEFSGIFKAVGGIFKAGADLLTGHWSRLSSDLKQIGSGILEAMTAPFKGAWAAIHSIGDDIIGFVQNIWSSISHLGSKVADIAKHPIKSIESMFASGTTSRYPNGLPKNTRAVVNDGNGPELIQFGNGFGMYKGRNVHTVLPKGSHVYNAADTKSIVGAQHFAKGTTSLNTNLKVGKNNLASSIQESGKLANRNFTKMSHQLTTQNASLNNKMYKTTAAGSKKIDSDNTTFTKKTIDNFTSMGKQLNPIWSKTIDAFGTYFAKLGPNAKTGMQGAVDALNQGISGIDKTLQQFGGNDSVLSPIHYAHGTNGVANVDHTAIVNDAKTGPQMEAIVNQAGQARYVSGTNAATVIHKGESVLTGQDTLTAINEGLIPHYAKGKSSKSTLRYLAKANAKNSKSAFNTEFTQAIQLKGAGLQKGLTKMGSNASSQVNTGYRWSSAMWKVINNAIQGQAASGLLAAVEKYGTGKKYVWGATGPDSFDCSGLVQYALKHAFGIDYPRTSGMQISKASGISRSEAQPGDLVGNAEHIGVVADKGARHYFSAFNPSSHPNILMTPLNGTYFPGTPKFGRVQGIKSNNSDSSGLKGVSPYMKRLVTSELGSSALSAITKKLSDGGASGNPAGDGVQRWKPLVLKALGALHLSTSTGMVDKVLRQINTESSGNPNAIGGTDGLNDGHAMGLMQVKPGTFAAYGNPALGKWNNGYASIYAGLNYAKHRYGSGLSFLGQGHGYAKGGRPRVGETAWVGEKGPELVHFDSPATIDSNVKSVSQLRNQNKSNGRNVTIAKGAISITVQGAKNAVEVAKEVDKKIEKRLHGLFHEGASDLQGGTI